MPRRPKAPQAAKKPTQTQHVEGVVRIIGGEWRSRKLRFHSTEGLRPSSDRIRETLFNWLAPTIAGAHCLDLFAGSGALGLEALSRGAEHCDFVELHGQTANQIRLHLHTLRCDRAQVHTVGADAFLLRERGPWDVVFLDPPFGTGLLQPAIGGLSPLLREGAQVYIETAKGEGVEVPRHWVEEKHKTAGQVDYRLYRVGDDETF